MGGAGVGKYPGPSSSQSQMHFAQPTQPQGPVDEQRGILFPRLVLSLEAQAAAIPACPAYLRYLGLWAWEEGKRTTTPRGPRAQGAALAPARKNWTHQPEPRAGRGRCPGGAGRGCGEEAGLLRQGPVARRARGWRAARAEGLGRAPRDLSGPWVSSSLACPGTGLAASWGGRGCPARCPPGPRGHPGPQEGRSGAGGGLLGEGAGTLAPLGRQRLPP